MTREITMLTIEVRIGRSFRTSRLDPAQKEIEDEC